MLQGQASSHLSVMRELKVCGQHWCHIPASAQEVLGAEGAEAAGQAREYREEPALNPEVRPRACNSQPRVAPLGPCPCLLQSEEGLETQAHPQGA